MSSLGVGKVVRRNTWGQEISWYCPLMIISTFNPLGLISYRQYCSRCLNDLLFLVKWMGGFSRILVTSLICLSDDNGWWVSCKSMYSRLWVNVIKKWWNRIFCDYDFNKLRVHYCDRPWESVQSFHLSWTSLRWEVPPAYCFRFLSPDAWWPPEVPVSSPLNTWSDTASCFD